MGPPTPVMMEGGNEEVYEDGSRSRLDVHGYAAGGAPRGRPATISRHQGNLEYSR